MRTEVALALAVVVGASALFVRHKLARPRQDEGSSGKVDSVVQGQVTSLFDSPDGSVTEFVRRPDGTTRVRVTAPLPEGTPTDVLERVRIIVSHHTGVDVARISSTARLSDLSSDMDELDVAELIFSLEEHGRPNVVISLPDSALFKATGAHNMSELPRRTTVAVLARIVEQAPKARVVPVAPD